MRKEKSIRAFPFFSYVWQSLLKKRGLFCRIKKKVAKIFVFHLVTNNLVIIFATFLTKKEPEFPFNRLIMWEYWVVLASVINVENQSLKK